MQDALGASHLQQVEVAPGSFGLSADVRPTIRALRKERNRALHKPPGEFAALQKTTAVTNPAVMTTRSTNLPSPADDGSEDEPGGGRPSLAQTGNTAGPLPALVSTRQTELDSGGSAHGAPVPEDALVGGRLSPAQTSCSAVPLLAPDPSGPAGLATKTPPRTPEVYHLPDLDVAESAAEATPAMRTDADDRPPEILDSGGVANGATDIPAVPALATPTDIVTVQTLEAALALAAPGSRELFLKYFTLEDTARRLNLAYEAHLASPGR